MTDTTLSLPEPWLVVDEDPLTGLRNLLGLISDLSGPLADSAGCAVGLDVRGLATINREKGRKAGDQALVALARALERAASTAGQDRVNLYRLGGDEFCAVIRGGSDDAAAFLVTLEGDRELPPFRHCVVEFGAGWNSPEEAFIELWLPLEQGLRSAPGGHEPPLRYVAQRLTQQVKETLDQLKDSRRLAYTDDISGLANHRAARYRIDQLMAGSIDADAHLSLLFIDGDNLRRYNDELGYGAGNGMIRRLGAVISGATMPGEMVARWLSGDEFMVVLPGYAKADAMAKAESICKKVREESAGWVFPVTVSAGVATFPDDARDLESLLSRAEEANAMAKNLGKDRACSII